MELMFPCYDRHLHMYFVFNLKRVKMWHFSWLNISWGDTFLKQSHLKIKVVLSGLVKLFFFHVNFNLVLLIHTFGLHNQGELNLNEMIVFLLVCGVNRDAFMDGLMWDRGYSIANAQWLPQYCTIFAYMRRWAGSSLVQIMACRLFGAKPLSEPMLEYCQLNP